MRGADAIELVEILIKHLRVGRVNQGHFIRLGQPWQCAHAALGKHRVAMTFGISHAALVAERRIKAARQAERIRGFLRQPPGIFAAPAIVVVTATQPVHPRHVNRVAPHVFQRTVATTITANLCVPVKFAADDL